MLGNILGSPIEPTIAKQIDARQKVFGASSKGSSTARSPEVLNYLNNRNIWIKFASGVYVKDTSRITNLSEQNYLNNAEASSLQGINLAKEYILFNGVQSSREEPLPNQRKGVRSNTTWTSGKDAIYGGMGGSERGLQPIPGILSVSVESLNRGSIRKAEVKIKAYNKFQFGVIETLYLRLGFCMMLEFGWDKYINSNSGAIQDVGSTLIDKSWFSSTNTQREMLNLIEAETTRYQGNYNGFFGKVNNFSWDLKSDGSYDITVNLITLGSVIESLNVFVPSSPLTKGQLNTRKEKLREIYQIQTAETETSDVGGDGEDSPAILTNMGSDRLSTYLAQVVATFKSRELFKDQNYAFLPNAVGTVGNTVSVTLSEEQNKNINKTTTVASTGDNSPAATAKALLTVNTTSDSTLNAKINVSAASNTLSSNNSSIEANRKKIPPTSKFYIRFEELLKQIQNNVVFEVNTKGSEKGFSMLEFEHNPNYNLINYEPNLIPLDPSICIFKPLYTAESKLTDSVFLPEFKDLKTFAISEKGCNYGLLMNIYFNTTFIAEVLNSNKNENNELDLFNFLQKLLDGINRCMGGVTELTVSIKNDTEIYFIDENPIAGFNDLYNNSTSVYWDIFGYNPDKGTSGFVTDFSFQTKITPKLMTQISIGATAAGSTTNTLDAVGYKNWHRGLDNRFQYKTSDGNLTDFIEQAAAPTTTTDGGVAAVNLIAQSKYKAELEQMRAAGSNLKISSNGTGYTYTYKTEEFTVKDPNIQSLQLNNFESIGTDSYDSFQNSIKANLKAGINSFVNAASNLLTVKNNALNSVILTTGATDESLELSRNRLFQNKEFIAEVERNFENIDKKFNKLKLSIYNPDTDGEQTDYPSYLVDAFGGLGQSLVLVGSKPPSGFYAQLGAGFVLAKSNNLLKDTEGINKTTGTAAENSKNQTYQRQSTPLSEALYWYSDSNKDFVDRGYNAFKRYYAKRTEGLFQDGVTTGKTGFIPVSLSITCDGIAGIKIYNSITVNTKFLPQNYPSALSFIIDGISHNIEGNKWTTEISTISQPKTTLPPERANVPAKQVVDEFYANTDPVEAGAESGVVSTWNGPPEEAKTLTRGYSLLGPSPTGIIYKQIEKPKIQFVMHHTAGNYSIDTCIGIWRRPKSAQYRICCHYIIQRDGTYEQLIPLKWYGNHIGSTRDKGNWLQQHSISVELEGLGYLKKKTPGPVDENTVFQQSSRKYNLKKLRQGQPDFPVGKPYKLTKEGKLVEWGTYKGYDWYQTYTKKQLATLSRVMIQVTLKYPNIKMGVNYKIFYEKFPVKKTAKSTGLGGDGKGTGANNRSFTHNSYRSDKSDVFPQKELIQMLMKFPI